MVGVVIVSHGARLAEGVVELARGMAGPDVAIAAVGGILLPDGNFALGTDAVRIAAAIEQVDRGDGVVVLLDLGSAILSAQTALDFLSPDLRERVVLADAPLVEGAVVAAVQARLGRAPNEIAAEARRALEPKQQQLAPPGPVISTSIHDLARLEAQSAVVTLRELHGLHVRPAARLVEAIAPFAAEIEVTDLTNGRGPANPKSLIELLLLSARTGDELRFVSRGDDATAALAAVSSLFDHGFDDEIGATAESEGTVEGTVEIPGLDRAKGEPEATFRGDGASAGVGHGISVSLHAGEPSASTHKAGDSEGEVRWLDAAIEQTAAVIRLRSESARRRSDPEAAAIVDASLQFLSDDALVGRARRAIREQGQTAAVAWRGAVESVASRLDEVNDPYLRARAADVNSVGRQVVDYLGGRPSIESDTLTGIVVAADLGADEVSQLDPTRVQGLCLASGSRLGHAAIVARGLGIPTVVGLGGGILAVPDGTHLLIDGTTGEAWIDPDLSLVEKRTRDGRQTATEQRTPILGAAVTADRQRVPVLANVGSIAEARAAVAAGADGIGLLRTEFLFFGRSDAPTEAEQLIGYRGIAEVLGGRPLTIRTLDAGGDKPLPYLGLPAEVNPNLGFRAIRIGLAFPEFFKSQLRAIVRLASSHPVRVMFPMIATVDEFRAARELLRQAIAEVRQRGQPCPESLSTGIMVEVPAAAILAKRFASEVDFFSIGTNDLAQFALAADRGDGRLGSLADPLQPAVLELIRSVVDASRVRGIPVAVCGELAGEVEALPLLLGLGVQELSARPNAIPGLKHAIRRYRAEEGQRIAASALQLTEAASVRDLLAQFRPD